MNIEPYSDNYFLDVVRLIEGFHQEAVKEYDMGINIDSIIETVKDQRENAFVLVVDGKCEGVIAGRVFKSMLNDGAIFQETIWYVSPSFRRYGVKLLREAEKILKSRGVSIMIMVALENSKADKLRKFYNKLGYKRMEEHFMRAL